MKSVRFCDPVLTCVSIATFSCAISNVNSSGSGGISSSGSSSVSLCQLWRGAATSASGVSQHTEAVDDTWVDGGSDGGLGLPHSLHHTLQLLGGSLRREFWGLHDGVVGMINPGGRYAQVHLQTGKSCCEETSTTTSGQRTLTSAACPRTSLR